MNKGINTIVTSQNTYLISTLLKEDMKGSINKAWYLNKFWKPTNCIIKKSKTDDFIDAHGRGMKERLNWQKELHQRLYSKLPIPKLVDAYENNNETFLVLEYVTGLDFNTIIKEEHKDLHWNYLSGSQKFKLLSYYLTIVGLIDKLHHYGYIHRDITGSNFMITPEKSVVMIDLELVYSFNLGTPSPPFSLGTFGFMSPEQEKEWIPSISDDVYSLGALLLKVITGIEPINILDSNESGRRKKIDFYTDNQELTEIIDSCLLHDNNKRPSLQVLKKRINQFLNNDNNFQLFNKSQHYISTKADLCKIIDSGISALSSPLMLNNGLWFSEDTTEGQPSSLNTKKTLYGLNKGLSGVLYFMGIAHKAGFDITDNLSSVTCAINHIVNSHNSLNLSASLHYGMSGIAVGINSMIANNLVSESVALSSIVKNSYTEASPWLSIIHGAAGQAIGVMLCKDTLGDSISCQLLDGYISFLINKQQKDGSWHIPINKDGRIIEEKQTGFGYGIAGIIWVLLEYGSQYGHKSSLEAAFRGLCWLTQAAISKKDILLWHNTPRQKDISSWWCNGAPGISLTYMKAFAIIGDQSYQDIAQKALLTIPDGFIHQNLGQCHGLSGIGEIYLQAYQTFKSNHWLDKADWIREIILNQCKTENGQLYWLAENKDFPTADLMVGNCGILHFLIRRTTLDSVGFPLLPEGKSSQKKSIIDGISHLTKV